MFNYANGTEAEKAWVDGITNVALVAADERNNTLNENLDYTLDKAYPHNGGTVACIQVPLGQSNFFSNGRYQLRVTSQGESKLFPIHVVNETVPSMTLTDDQVESGEKVPLPGPGYDLRHHHAHLPGGPDRPRRQDHHPHQT